MPPDPPADPPAAGQRSVLIVDDDRWTTRALAAVLGACPDLTILPPSHTAPEAVTAYRSHRPDVVLMDLNMPPGAGGIEAITAIIAGDPDACIVVLTTVSPGPGIARALDAGALAAVSKSAPDEELIAVVRQIETDLSPVLLRDLAGDILLSGDTLPDAPAVPPRLTERELAILRLICEGCDYAAISERLCVEVTTVKTHARSLREKLYAGSLAQLVVRALQFKFYTPS